MTYAGKYRSATFRPRDVATTAVVTAPYIRPTERPASLRPAHDCWAAKSDVAKYSGTECIGIAAMHKSNLVPVFSAQEATDTAKMRRG